VKLPQNPNIGKQRFLYHYWQSCWLDRAEQRAKPTKLEPVKPVVEPPEFVSVEMTPEEQDVYAFMGVSPLVRLNRAAKNSRSVIINVTLPGQLPVSSNSSENEAPDSEPEQDSVSGTLSEETLDSGINDSGFEANKMILPIKADQESFPDVPESEPSLVARITDESEVEANSVSVNRRRRRRSSATENKAED
jgi:ribonuclease E